MTRWPTVFCGDLCGEHDWKCENPDCRERARPRAFGPSLCAWHESQQPRGRAVWAA